LKSLTQPTHDFLAPASFTTLAAPESGLLSAMTKDNPTSAEATTRETSLARFCLPENPWSQPPTRSIKITFLAAAASPSGQPRPRLRIMLLNRPVGSCKGPSAGYTQSGRARTASCGRDVEIAHPTNARLSCAGVIHNPCSPGIRPAQCDDQGNAKRLP